MKNFLSAETTAKRALSSYHAEKKPPTFPNISIFPLLKDAVHAHDMQQHLVKLCTEYTNTLDLQQMTVVDYSDQPINALSEII